MRRGFNATVAALLALGLAAAGGARAADAPLQIIAFGDSLSAGYGVQPEESFPARLQAALAKAGIAAEVANAGVSGDTTAGGVARLNWALAGVPGGSPDLVIVEFGANDAMRGLDPAKAKANLDIILSELKRRGVPALLAGMKAPRNMGPEYVTAFDGIYPALAESHGVPLYPFFLEGVAADPALNQADGIHPNPKGVDVIVAGILPYVVKALGKAPPD